MSEVVKITYSQSPLNVISSDGEEYYYKEKFDNGIYATESFPKSLNSGKYELELYKEVSNSIEAKDTHDELVGLLRQLVFIFPFTGGNFFRLVNYSQNLSSNIESNYADIVRTFKNFPLKLSKDILREKENNMRLSIILEDYYTAGTSFGSWYVYLYKVKDSIEIALKVNKLQHNTIGIENEDISSFERILNDEFGLRHSYRNLKKIKKINIETKDNVMQIGKDMICKYLDYLNLKHIA